MFATLFIGGWLLASVIFVLGGCRLSVQSSYYADPTRRFCGTLDQMGTWLDHGFNLLIYYIKMLIFPIRKAIGIPLNPPEKQAGLKSLFYYPSLVLYHFRNTFGALYAPRRPVRDVSRLGFYEGIKQWWWRSTPTSNIRARKRFQDRRRDMELPEWKFWL
jgi:hypothetical protein